MFLFGSPCPKGRSGTQTPPPPRFIITLQVGLGKPFVPGDGDKIKNVNMRARTGTRRTAWWLRALLAFAFVFAPAGHWHCSNGLLCSFCAVPPAAAALVPTDPCATEHAAISGAAENDCRACCTFAPSNGGGGGDVLVSRQSDARASLPALAALEPVCGTPRFVRPLFELRRPAWFAYAPHAPPRITHTPRASRAPPAFV